MPPRLEAEEARSGALGCNEKPLACPKIATRPSVTAREEVDSDYLLWCYLPRAVVDVGDLRLEVREE